MMRFAPPSYRPEREKLHLRTRDEVVYKWVLNASLARKNEFFQTKLFSKDPDWIAEIEQKRQKEIKDQDERETREWNQKVLGVRKSII